MTGAAFAAGAGRSTQVSAENGRKKTPAGNGCLFVPKS